MKKILSLCLLGVFLLSLTATPGLCQKEKEILEKWIEAQGGRKTLAAVKDTTLVGTLEIPMAGMRGSISMYHKEPNKMRMDMEIMGMVMTTAYDGVKVWFTNPQTGATEDMSGEEAEQMIRQSLGNDSILNPGKYGITYAYKGEEKVDDKDCIVLDQTFSDGYTATLYIDSKTFLTCKTKAKTLTQMGAEAEAETYFADYRKVGDVMVSHSMKVFYDGQEAVSMTFSQVKFNSGLDDALFRKN